MPMLAGIFQRNCHEGLAPVIDQRSQERVPLNDRLDQEMGPLGAVRWKGQEAGFGTPFPLFGEITMHLSPKSLPACPESASIIGLFRRVGRKRYSSNGI